jgi:DNA topoisomerase-3
MQLFIAEKPSAAKALAAELGITGRDEGFIKCGKSAVTWCFGHLFEQAEPDAYTADDIPRGSSGRKIWRVQDLPIVPSTWLLRTKPDAKKQLAIIGRLLKEASEIVHAGDPDREGQLLVDEVLEHFRIKKPVRRFWVSAQDAVSIRRGLENLRDGAAFAGMADAARARQRADWLIGMNLSRAYTLRAQRGGSRALLTVGRVQTPTLALVVARDREIESFKSRPYYTLEASFEHVAGSFSATWKPKEEQVGLDQDGRLVDALVATAIAAAVTGKPGSITAYTTEAKKKAPPTCFALSDITLLASQKYGASAEQVLQACQALYEVHKLTSYPRTDCGYLPRSQHADARAVLAAVLAVNPELKMFVDRAQPAIVSPTWNDAKVTAHHGIVPTMHLGTKSNLTALEAQIYELIVRRYLSQFYPDHEYLQTRVRVDVGGEAFAATGNVVTQAGWREVDKLEDAEPEAPKDEPEAARQSLPAMRTRDPVTCVEAQRKDKHTKPPARFTEGTLVRAMEQIHKWVSDPEHKKLLREGDGIGTSATRASILGDLKRREFLASQGKQLISTPLGRALVDALPAAVKSPVLTALYERLLKDVEAGDVHLEAFVERQAAFVAERVAEARDGSFAVPAATPAQPVRQTARATRSKKSARRYGRRGART